MDSSHIYVPANKSTWSGYKTVTTYFVDYKVNSDNKYEFDVEFSGILPKGEVVEGSLSQDDTNDVFSFEVKDPKTIDSVENNLLKNSYNADAAKTLHI